MSTARKILCSVLGFAAFLIAAILYSFIDSRVADKPEQNSPQAYGLDSLEYVADPVMDLIVWQRNSLSHNDYDIPGYSEFYYEKTVLPLREGEMVLSHTEDGDMSQYGYLTLTIEYDGKITGQYDFTKPEVLFYSGNNTTTQARHWGAENEYFTEDDATFVGNQSVTISLVPYCVINRDYYYGGSNVKHDKYVEDWLKDRSVRDSFDRENFCVLQKFRDIYPDGPELFAEAERSVTTTVLTINAMHPTKEDVVVATADIQIKTYSMWYIAEKLEVEDRMLFLEEYMGDQYSEITVLSYEQSDSFSW